MRILQLTSDWKWTGPAEPMLRLALALRARGCQVHLACPESPEPESRSLAHEARREGMPPDLGLAVARGLRWWGDRGDVARLRGRLREQAIDVVHTWHTRDHLLALRAAGLGRRRGPTRIVRSFRKAEPITPRPWNRFLFGPGCDGLVCVSPETARANAGLRGGRPFEGVFGAVDGERFAPAPPDPEVRASLGLAPEHRVVGVVARVQSHRRFDLLLAAAARLCARDPQARLLVVGRGTRHAALAVEPARKLGLEDRVLFAGYRSADYADVLRCIDLFTFLVPGSDGTCRALLEAAACGIPAVTTRRGALPEIVLDEQTGILVDEDPDALASGWGRLLADPAARARLGEAARKRALEVFSPEHLADQMLAFYRRVVGS